MISKTTFAEIFGDQAAAFLDIFEIVVPKLNGVTIDWTEEDFNDLSAQDLDEAQKQYWTELLGRAYVAAAGTIVRQWQWIDGLCTAYESAAYLPFAGSLRGLLESTADSMHALKGAPLTLAKLSNHISRVLNDEKPEGFVGSKELEQELIHFTYAKKFRKSDPHPEGHRALQTRDYVDQIKKFNPALETLYCDLCELVHPASNSVLWMLDSEAGKPWKIKFVADRRADYLVKEMVKEHKSELLDLLLVGMNSAMVTLKVIRHFDVAELDLEFTDSINLSGVPLWAKVVSEIENPSG